MAVTYIPFASGAGANVSETGWGQMARHWLGTGVLHGELSDSLVYGDSSGMQVKVKPGRAWVEGYFFQDDGSPSDTVLSIAAADPTNPRLDLVVLRLDHTAASVAYQVLTGTPAGSPVAPTPTQTVGGRWEVPLATVAVAAAASTIAAGNVSDQRQWAAVGWGKVTPAVNALVNGGLENWQRGNGAFTANNAFTGDRWQIGLGASSTISVSKDTTHQDAQSVNCAAVTYTHVATSTLGQKLEDYAQLRGRFVAFSVRVRTTVAGGATAVIDDGGSNVFVGSSHSGSGTYETLTVAAFIPATVTALWAKVRFSVTGTYYVDNAMLVPGGQPVDYVPLSPADDLARCQRYYEFIGGVASSLGFYGYAPSNGASVLLTLPYKVPKAVVPTLGKVGTWTVNNCGQPTVGNPSTTTCTLTMTATLTGACNCSVSNATDGITIEANP